jgi:hypothetical protein
MARGDASVIDLVREYGILRFAGMTGAFMFVLTSIVLVLAVTS